MIYFLYGSDNYRSNKKLEEIILGYKKVHKSGLNLIYINAAEGTFKDFYSNLKTNSMFAEKKLIVLKNIFDNEKFQEDFLKEIKNLEGLKDIIVIYEDKSADQRTKLFKELKKHAKCQEFENLKPSQLRNWVAHEFAIRKTKISFDAMDLLITFVGSDLWRMANEINKLSVYKPVIEKKDVELLVKTDIENDIFRTIDALASKDKKQALNLLHKHLEDGDSPLYLLSMITYQFRNLLIIKESPKNTGLHPFVVQKCSYLCRQFTMEKLKKIYLKIFQIDSDIKIGKLEPETALDLLLSEI